MAQNICNICGANYKYKNGKWVCPACGAYKPEELSNEEVTLLYNASQKIRLALFDDAEEQYKDIVSKYPDNPDGYWGLVLAKYGIKYEQDYDGKMIPSCYAASYESVLTDKNYLKAIELADKDNRKYYEEQASKIEKIRKEWIEKASKEEPYDIFISYKDTEKENGTERTKDSYDALELYTMLTKLGYRVFYSRESLKDKTGEKYEPYIFNALNTAHTMIVYGSKPEYIESTWIKNEWMRFYKRIKLGKKQPNALLVVYNGFNPAELPSPLSKMQNLDRSRIDFSREIESYCKKVIKAATTVLPKIERVEIKAKKGKVGQIVKIQAIELKNNSVPKAEIVREEVKKREIGNYTVSKLTANAENELKVAYAQLAGANFNEAKNAFNNFLVKNPKNGRALTGKLLAENKNKELDEFSSIGVKTFADWKLLEQVLLFSEKTVSEKILKALCEETVNSFNSGNLQRARDIYAQISSYEDNNVTEMRKAVCDLAKGFIGKDNESAKYFIDGYLIYEQNEVLFLEQIKQTVNVSIEKGDFGFAKEYVSEWLKYESDDFSANLATLKIKYQVKTLTEVFSKIESKNNYGEIDDILHKLNEESAGQCFKTVCERVNALLTADNFGKEAFSYIDKFFRYNFAERNNYINKFLSLTANKATENSAKIFDLLLSLSDYETEDYNLYILKFADNALKNGNFDLADKYYDKINELHETALSWEGKLKCHLKARNEAEYSANIKNLTEFSFIDNILSLLENDDKRATFIIRLIGYVYATIKTAKSDTEKCVKVFENLLAYMPKDYDSKLIEWLFKFARFLKSNGNYNLAEKLYATIVNYDAENHVAYWEMLQAKLNCKDENAIIHQQSLISEFQEFQNALLASANNDAALKHYIEIQNKQKAWVEKEKQRQISAKKRKKFIKIVSIVLAAVIIITAGIFGGVTYYNSESILKYDATDSGLSVYSGKYYKADETLIIPDKVNNKFVTEIKAEAFKNHTEIKKVIIPTAVTKIGDGAFEGCVNLESVEIKDIENNTSFANATANVSLKTQNQNGISLFAARIASAETFSVNDNNSNIKLSIIGSRAFKGCTKLNDFTLNYGLKTIGEEAFSGTGLKEITIPETVEFVGKAAFENCKDLVNIEVGDRDEIPQDWDVDWNKGQETKVEFSVRVIFDYNGADEIIKSEQYVVYDKTYSFPVPVKEGYTFVGWYRGDVKLTDNNGLSLNAWNYQDGGTVKAEFTANENTVFFNGNGATSGETESLKIHTAESANLNSNGFIKEGYTFKGWATSSNGTKVYDDNALYTMGKNSSYVLYAVWQANTNVLHFNANGGSGTMTDKNINTDSTATLSANTFTRDGYTFAGWATSANGAKVYNDKANYTMGTDEEYTLYAVWTTISYGLSYNLNGGTLSNENPTGYNIETETFTLNNPTRNGYTFNGWSGTDIEGQNVVVTVAEGSIGTRSYTANWTANLNTLHFSANGGSGTMADENINTDSTATLSANTFTRDGYTFVGWATSANGAKVYNDKANFTMGTDEEYTLYAVWSATPYSLSYNLNDGTLSIENPTGYNIETETFTLNNPTRNGYTFNGWSGTEISGLSMTVTIANGSVGNRSYIANWEIAEEMSNFEFVSSPNSFTITGIKNKTVTEITVPDYVTEIGDWAFSNCSNLNNVTLGRSIIRIGESAFRNSDAITSIYFTGNILNWCNIVFEDKWANPISQSGDFYIDNKLVTDIVIPNSIITIGNYQFRNCSNITSVEMPDGITTIGEDAFEYCWGLERINLPEGVVSIGREAFAHCDNLTSLIIPHSVTSIGDLAFAHYDGAPRYLYYKGTLVESQNLISSKQYDSGDVYWTVFSYSETKPSQSGNYWHYVNAEPYIWGYSITYHLNGGYVDSNLTAYTVYMNNITINNPSRDGYTFTGWSGTGINGLSKNVVIEKGSIGDREYSANWEANINTLHFNANGGTGEMTDVKMRTDNTETLSANAFTRKGYSFTGWATSANGSKLYNDNASYTMGSNAEYTLYAVWSRDNYNIGYNMNGGSVANTNPTTYNVDTATFTLNNPTRTGYNFIGWSGTDVTDNSLVVTITQGSVGNRSYTANWSIITYDIAYNLDGGTANDNPTNYTVATNTFTLNNPTRLGYNFIGWSGTGISGTSSSVSISKGSIGNRSYTANWQIIEYTVSCDLAGGSVSGNMTKYTVEDTFALNNPTRAGYTFAGWSGTDISGKSMSVSVPKGSVGNRSYAANWTPNQNVIILTDGTSSVQTTGYTDDYARLPANTFVKENYEFKGWATTQGGDVAYYDRDLYPVGPNSSYTLYAVWEDRTGWIAISTPNQLKAIANDLNGKYYLTNDIDMDGIEWIPIGDDTHAFNGQIDGCGYSIYNLNNVVGKKIYTDKKKIGQYAGLNYYAYTSYYSYALVGCSGHCWYGGENGIVNNLNILGFDVKTNLPNDDTSRSDKYYYKACKGIIVSVGNKNSDTYAVRNCIANGFFNAELNNIVAADFDGTTYGDNLNNNYLGYISFRYDSGIYDYQSAKQHSIVNLHLNIMGKAGYTFIGWSLSEGGAVKYHAGDECFIPLDKTSLTLYPVWQANTNEVIFNSNGGNGEMSNQQIQTDATAKLSANVFTKTGYHFIGWATTSNGQVAFADKADYTMGINSSYTLYAVWEQNTNEIIFNASRGSGTMTNQQALTNTTVTLNQCTFTAPMGYYFAGWSEDPNGSADYTDGALFSVGTNSAYKLYAIWNLMPETSTDYFTFSLQDDDSYAITSVSDNLPSVVIIPKMYNEKKVKTINSYAFKDCVGLTAVIIPNGIEVKKDAFYNCVSLQVFEIGRVGDIYDINATTQKHFPIGVYFGSEGSAIESMELVHTYQQEWGLNDVGYLHYYSYSSYMPITLKTITVNSSIGCGYAFYNCKNIERVNLLGTAIIPRYAFKNCSGLKEVHLTDKVKTIETETFANCSNLTSITFYGTIEQWNAIEKGTDWNAGISSSCIIHCLDGNICA